MSIDKATIDKTANLARLKISDSRKEKLITEISDILNYVDKINQLDTDNVHPTDFIVEHETIFRNDVAAESLPIDDIAKIVPVFKDGFIVVPQIIEQD